MRVCDFEFEYKKPSEKFRIYLASDGHLGNLSFERKKFRKLIQIVAKDKKAYLGLVGDLSECITPRDKRFNLRSIDRRFIDPNEQYQELYETLKPIEEKLIAFWLGNHELTMRKYNFLDIIQTLARELNTNYLGYDGFLDLLFRRIDDTGKQQHSTKITIFGAHGSGGGRLRGSRVNRIESMAKDYKADIYVFGHSHDLFVTGDIYLEKQGKQVIERPRLYASTGTFMKSYKTNTFNYSEQTLMSPLRVGCVMLTIKPENKEFEGKEVLF